MRASRSRSCVVGCLTGVLLALGACGPTQGPAAAKAVAQKVEAKAAAAESPSGLAALKQLVKGASEVSLRNLGVLLWTAHAPTPASYVLALAVEADPEDWLALNDLGAVLNTLKEYQLALEILQVADQLRPHDPLILDNLAAAEDGLGNDSKAEGDLRAALAILPGDPQANLSLGLLLENEGNTTAAQPYLLKARSLAYTENNDVQSPADTAAGTDPIPLVTYVHYPQGGPPAVDLGLAPPQLPDKYQALQNTAGDISQAAMQLMNQGQKLEQQADAVGVGHIPSAGTTAYQAWLRSQPPPPYLDLVNFQDDHWNAIQDLLLTYQDRDQSLTDTFSAKLDQLAKALQAQIGPLAAEYRNDTTCAGITDPLSLQACQEKLDQHYCALEQNARQATYTEAVKDYQTYYNASTLRLQEAANQMAWNVAAFDNPDDYQAMNLDLQFEVDMDSATVFNNSLMVARAENATGTAIDCGPPDPALAQAIRAALKGGSQKTCGTRLYVPIPGPTGEPIASIDVRCAKLKIDVDLDILRVKVDVDTSNYSGMVFVGVGGGLGFEGANASHPGPDTPLLQGIGKGLAPHVGADAGVYTTFDSNGFTDLGFQVDASGSLGGSILHENVGYRLGMTSGLTRLSE